MKKKDFYILLVVLALVLGSFLIRELAASGNKNIVWITVDGVFYGEYKLNEDQQISIGETNCCEIKDGEVKMVWANCPDQLCVHQKALNEKGQGSIICLPNQVVIEVRSQEKTAGPDVVAD